jgi:hypothetical protein
MSEPSMSFQEQLERFRERTAEHRGTYRGLILLGSKQRSPTTAALLIDALQPARVAFLLTAETRALAVPANVAREIKGDSDTWLFLTRIMNRRTRSTVA